MDIVDMSSNKRMKEVAEMTLGIYGYLTTLPQFTASTGITALLNVIHTLVVLAEEQSSMTEDEIQKFRLLVADAIVVQGIRIAAGYVEETIPATTLTSDKEKS